MAPTLNSKKVGADGLTKYQRYYQKHKTQVKDKNREHGRKLREQKQERSQSIADDAVSVNTSTTELADAHTMGLVDAPIADVELYSVTPYWPANEAMPPTQPPLSDREVCATVTASLVNHTRPAIAPEMDSELDRLEHLRRKVVYWSSGWGGILVWTDTLNLSFRHAVGDNQTDRWVAEVLRHAASGRRLLANLQEIEGRLPEGEWRIRELWRISIELVQLLVKGITIIESRVSLLPMLELGGDVESDAEPELLQGMELLNEYSSTDDEDCAVHVIR